MNEKLLHTAVYSFLLLLCTVVVPSCGLTEEEINTQAKKVFDQRVSQLIAKKQAECKQEAERIAETIVDSIIYELQINPLNDSGYSPPIPKRPEFVPVDSAVFNSKYSVKPILPES